MSGNREDAGNRHCLAVIDGLILTEDAFRQGRLALAPGKRPNMLSRSTISFAMADPDANGL